MGKPSAPEPPDPKETGAAQTATNVTTALANAQLGNVNQVGPDGSITYSQSEGQSFTDPTTGATIPIPQYTQTTTLSPEQQAIKDQNNQASLNLSTLGNTLSGTLGDQLTGNFSLGNEETEARLFELGSKRLAPKFEQGREALETRLANQGIGLGTEAYDKAIGNFGQQENDAFNQLLLQGRGQASQELLTEDNQRINQIGALMSGGQVSQPTFGAVNNPQLPNVDYAGLVNENYNQRLGAYNQEVAGRNSLFGGILGGVGNLVALSDERAKENKVKIGSLDGLGVYEYDYKGAPSDAPKSVGFMAQEVKKKKPEAVSKGLDGLFRVDYGKALA